METSLLFYNPHIMIDITEYFVQVPSKITQNISVNSKIITTSLKLNTSSDLVNSKIITTSLESNISTDIAKKKLKTHFLECNRISQKRYRESKKQELDKLKKYIIYLESTIKELIK